MCFFILLSKSTSCHSTYFLDNSINPTVDINPTLPSLSPTTPSHTQAPECEQVPERSHSRNTISNAEQAQECSLVPSNNVHDRAGFSTPSTPPPFAIAHTRVIPTPLHNEIALLPGVMATKRTNEVLLMAPYKFLRTCNVARNWAMVASLGVNAPQVWQHTQICTHLRLRARSPMQQSDGPPDQQSSDACSPTSPPTHPPIPTTTCHLCPLQSP